VHNKPATDVHDDVMNRGQVRRIGGVEKQIARQEPRDIDRLPNKRLLGCATRQLIAGALVCPHGES
jgi:hypothetical protein